MKAIRMFRITRCNFVETGISEWLVEGTALDLGSVFEYLKRWEKDNKRKHGDKVEIMIEYKDVLDV